MVLSGFFPTNHKFIKGLKIIGIKGSLILFLSKNRSLQFSGSEILKKPKPMVLKKNSNNQTTMV
jgi:hypothetical protein